MARHDDVDGANEGKAPAAGEREEKAKERDIPPTPGGRIREGDSGGKRSDRPMWSRVPSPRSQTLSDRTFQNLEPFPAVALL